MIRAHSDKAFNSCGNTRLVGGFGILGSGSSLVKEFALPPHSSVTVRFELYKIDSWDQEDFYVLIDGV